jgi:hypothetical protein
MPEDKDKYNRSRKKIQTIKGSLVNFLPLK